MAGFISIDESREWSSANWVYWGFMDHVLDALKDSPEIAHRAEGSKWMQMLSFDILSEEDSLVADKILDACRVVAKKCSDGELLCKVDDKVLDTESQKQFQEAMQELVALLET
jgi:hypothetical protein